MGDKETGFDVTAIGIFPLLVEDLIVEVNVIIVDGIIEGDGNHLRHVVAIGACRTNLAEVTRNLCAILGTEAVRELANVAITWWGTIRVNFFLFGFQLTVFDRGLPITSLFLNVKE